MNLYSVYHVNYEVMPSGAAKKPYKLSGQFLNSLGA